MCRFEIASGDGTTNCAVDLQNQLVFYPRQCGLIPIFGGQLGCSGSVNTQLARIASYLQYLVVFRLIDLKQARTSASSMTRLPVQSTGNWRTHWARSKTHTGSSRQVASDVDKRATSHHRQQIRSLELTVLSDPIEYFRIRLLL